VRRVRGVRVAGGSPGLTPTAYLSSPGNQMHASYLEGMPVLLSFALYPKGRKKCPWVDDYLPTFARILIDSGAFSELNSGVKVDGGAYREWQSRWDGVPHVDAVAGLDDIGGDWRRSLKNYELYGGFPTFHDTDPRELLDELIPLARDRGGWLGVGLKPPRTGKWAFVRATMKRIPPDLHVHFWAGGEYSGHPRVNSWDSTNWIDDAFMYRNKLPFLTPAECVELVVKRYQRAGKNARSARRASESGPSLFDE
jgi:hypothetical protein